MAALLALVACETGPWPPPMSPLETAKRYGYAERPLGGDKYKVTYVGLTRLVSRFPGEREADVAAARNEANDFMLWRAAQLAQEHGYAGFHVDQTRSNVDTYVEDYPYDPFWGPPYPGSRRFGYPYFPGYTWPYYPGSGATLARIQPSVSADVTLRKAPDAGDYLAESVIERLRQTYPGAEGIVRPQ
jgi:hypothetical protein